MSRAERPHLPGPTPRRALSRRTVLAGMLGAGVAALAGCDAIPSTSPVQGQEFDRPLAIPPLAASRLRNGVRVFELTAQEGRTAFAPGIETPTWGFNAAHLGPTLRAARGERVAVEVTNELSETTSVHWHGMHLPARYDGGPHQPIEPGGTWRPTWRIDQPAATLWYHPHPHGATEEHVYRGLAGLFLLDDEYSRAASLPSEYGVDDVPVIVQDKKFDDAGRLDADSEGNEVGLFGDVVMTNGTVGAYHEVTTERIRLRLLNGSTARTYQFVLADRPFELVATDGGLLDRPVRMDSLRLAPGERAEIVVTMRPRERTVLRSEDPDLGGVAAPFAFGGNDSFDVLQLRAAEHLNPSPEPDWQHEDTGLAEAEATVTRTFELQNREINGRRMDMNRIDETVTVGTTEIWEVTNIHPVSHSFHIHDVQFEVLSVDGQAPPPELSGRKDTVYLEPNRTYRLIMRFEDYADPDWPYMYHCHMLLHEDEGMMGQFVVVETGQRAGEVAHHH